VCKYFTSINSANFTLYSSFLHSKKAELEAKQQLTQLILINIHEAGASANLPVQKIPSSAFIPFART
jgi:hypothetical protein